LEAEGWVRALVPWLRLGVETLEALTVALGMVLAAALFLRALLTRQIADFNAIRLTLARCLFHGYKWVPATKCLILNKLNYPAVQQEPFYSHFCSFTW